MKSLKLTFFALAGTLLLSFSANAQSTAKSKKAVAA